MTSFGWKRKKLTVKPTEVRDILNVSDSDEAFQEDWFHLCKHRKTFELESTEGKCRRLTKEGTELADQERFWEAINKWNEALLLMPKSERVHEMKSQVLLELGEIFPAVQSAEKAVECNPLWPHSYQTLGRAQLNLGEIDMAIKSFSRAIHINPTIDEVWRDDIPWAMQLRRERTLRGNSNDESV